MRQRMSAIFWFIKKCTWEDQARRHDLSTVETHSETQKQLALKAFHLIFIALKDRVTSAFGSRARYGVGLCPQVRV